MKPEKLLPLAGILAALLVIGFLVKRKPAQQDITKQYEVHRLVPEDLRVADIERAEFYRGADPKAGAAVSRTRDAQGEPTGWKVDSRFDAPGDATKIEGLLAKIRDREGEFRTDKAEVLGDFSLTDEQALHVVLYPKGKQEPAAHLLIGKSESYRGCFVRAAGKNTVYTLDVDLRTEMGIYGQDEKEQPDSGQWISKVVLDLEPAKIARIELTYPDKKVVLEKKKPEPEKKDGEKKEGEGKEPEAPPAAPVWVLAAGGPRTGTEAQVAPLTDFGSNTIVSALDKLAAGDVVDPAKKSEYGLDTPAYRCVAVMDDGKQHVLVAGRPEPGGEAYVVIEGTDRPVFKIERYYFDNLFKHGGELFELKGLALEEANVTRVGVRLPAGALVFERAKGETPKGWTLVEPAAKPAPAVRADKVDGLVQRFARWNPADYADDPAIAGLDAPAATLELATREGKSYRIELGKESKTVAGRYALLEDPDRAALAGGSPWVAGASDAALPLAPLGSYLDLKAVPLDEKQIARVVVTRAEKGFTLFRAVVDGQPGGPWRLQTPEGDKDVDGAKVDRLISSLVALSGSDIRFGADPATPPALPSVAFTLRVEPAAGPALELAFGAEEDGKVCAVPAGLSYGVLFAAGLSADLAPDPATLLAPAAPEKKDEAGKDGEKKTTEPKEGDGQGAAEKK